MTEKQHFGIGRPGWRPPSFPPGFPSMAHSPDRFSHQSHQNYVQPEVLLAAMAAASTAQQVLNERSARTNPYLTNMQSLNNSFTCPNCTYCMSARYMPADQSPHPVAFKRNSMSPAFNGNSSIFNNNDRSRHSGSVSNSPSVFQLNRMPLQKMRKPYFMPYISEGAMLRGLKNGDLFKGILRINRYNYEESYVEVSSGFNPNEHSNVNNNNANDSCVSAGGDVMENSSPKTTRSQHSRKLLLLSVHDRNRALHGDEVVVRIKDRSEWMVREALYQSWRSGELTALFDENGQPISIPPLKSSAEKNATKANEKLKFLPAAFHKRVSVENIDKLVPIAKDCHYDADSILQMGISMDNEPTEDVRKLLKSLLISRDTNKSSEAVNSFTFNSGRYHVTGHGPNRSTYRLLSDMPDEDWGIPDICLQKTAEVVYIFKAKNSREAVGQLKVMADGNRNWALFSPTDSRMPRMMVPADQLPEGFFEHAAEYSKMTFIAQIVEWAATAQFSRGKLIRQVTTTAEHGHGSSNDETDISQVKGTTAADASGSSSSYSCSPIATSST